jgi:GTPase SAR1 family protein
MHIVIEGPDCSGKTTLANQLCEMLSFEYRHEGPPLSEPTIIDRFALGERVYGPILRGKDRLGEEGLLKVQQVMLKLNVFQIICLPPNNALWKAFIDSSVKGNELLGPVQYEASIDAWTQHCRNTYLYDYTAPTALEQLLGVLSLWNSYAVSNTEEQTPQ